MYDLSIIIVTYNSAKDIGPCLDSIWATQQDLKVETFIVDNASKDRTVEIVRTEYPWVRMSANDFNAGFPAGNNQAITQADGRYLMLLNPDTVVLPGALQKIVAFMDAHAECGVCGPTLLDADGVVAYNLRRPSFRYYLVLVLGLHRFLRKLLPSQSLEIVSGACLVLRRNLVDDVGLLDENLFWCEDVDYCTRVIKAGYRVCCVDDARVVHLQGQSAVSNVGLVLDKQYMSKLRYFQKHEGERILRPILLLFIFQASLRVVRWQWRARFRPTEEACLRAKVLTRLTREMLRMLVKGPAVELSRRKDP